MIMHGICQLALIPVRKEPSEHSEMVTQLLFGETLDILDSKDTWSYIRSHFDGYTGWVSAKMLTLMDNPELETYQQAAKTYLKEPIVHVFINQTSAYLAGGSTFLKEDKQMAHIHPLVWPETLPEFHYINSPTDIPGTALKFIRSPYLWGGRTILGIDCSGFTQIVYKMNGIPIPRDAHQQAEKGMTIHSVEEALPGDLAFFHRDDGRIIHTGIILSNAQIIHASGHVRIDRIDHYGILNAETGTYSHKLKTIRRIIRMHDPERSGVQRS